MPAYIKTKQYAEGKMGSTRKGMLNVRLPPCCGEVQGSARNTSWSKPDVVAVFDYDAFDIRRFDSATLSFVHGDKIFSIINNHKDALVC